jgi:hypothetical protein
MFCFMLYPPALGRCRLQLQERATQMHALRAALDEARGGNGRLAAILGEAGIGKTSAPCVTWRAKPAGG